ncbi:S49 family peptidase [Hahella ganghwensis]|uniref:S49 family peptidase n=1 Tax=Hahella ganghwensis TaxID=286420 RepID=UPI000360493B|nr:S49 family peptidase [Hahella ganghwensis]
MPDFINIAARVFGKPLAVDPGYAKVFFSAIAPRLNIVELSSPEGEVLVGEKLRAKAASFSSDRDRHRPYMLHRGVAVLPVSGTLVHKHGYLQPYSGMTGYDGLVARAMAAAEDPEVKGILLDMDTPGGEVSGCFDCVEVLKRVGKDKPIWALTYDQATSGGFALASAAQRRLITQTGVSGSVGVIMAHVSREKEMENAGRKVTLIYSGKHKADGNPYQDLPDKVLNRYQKAIDSMRQEFATIVSNNIGISLEAVLNTEAAVFEAGEAVDIGFADQLINGHDAVDEFADHLNSKKSSKGAFQMSTETSSTPKVEDNTPDTEEKEPQTTPEPEASAFSAEDAAAITEMCADAGYPKLGAKLIREKASIDQVQQRLNAAKAITTFCKIAGADDKADAYIAEGLSAEAVGIKLQEAMADEDEETSINSAHNPIAANEDHSKGWDRAIKNTAPGAESNGWDTAIQSTTRGNS